METSLTIDYDKQWLNCVSAIGPYISSDYVQMQLILPQHYITNREPLNSKRLSPHALHVQRAANGLLGNLVFNHSSNVNCWSWTSYPIAYNLAFVYWDFYLDEETKFKGFLRIIEVRL